MATRVRISVLALAFATPLFAGESAVIDRAAADGSTMRLVETAGEPVTIRVAAIDGAGMEIGSGRVIVLRAGETRELRIDGEFAGQPLRIERLNGTGSVSVTPGGMLLHETDEIGRSKRRAVRPHQPKPTSVELIDQAEASGVLDSETALLYRVYALFGDARLPAQYRGDDRKTTDSLYLLDVQQRFQTLTPAVQAAVAPFLVPPAYADSWANRSSGAPRRISDTEPRCQSISAKWNYADGAKYPIRIWYNTELTDQSLAQNVASELDNVIWPKLVGLMQSAPVSDANEDCNGGDGRLDIYLADVSGDRLGFHRHECSLDPSYIVVRRDVTPETLTHEFFHAIQNSFPLAKCLSHPDYLWWTEASATWAPDYVYRDIDRRNTEYKKVFAEDFLNVPETALDVTGHYHEYGDYLLPFFVERSGGSADFVRVAWQNCATQPALEAFDRAVSGGFAKVWPEFAKANWNQDPIDDYKRWDNLSDHVPVTPVKQKINSHAKIVSLDYELPQLSAKFWDIKFTNDDSFVGFLNGAAMELYGGDGYGTQPASGDQTKGAHVTALIRKNNSSTWTTEDWTDRSSVSYCRDVTDERIDELVLIISNSEFQARDRGRKLKPPVLAPIVYASDIGCWRWKGEATFNIAGFSGTATVNWTRRPADATIAFGIVPYAVQSGAAQWTFSYLTCSTGGSIPLGPDNGGMSTYNALPPGSKFFAGYGAAGSSPPVSVCGATAVSFPWLTPPRDYQNLKVSQDGRTIDGSSNFGGGSWQWHFTAEREP